MKQHIYSVLLFSIATGFAGCKGKETAATGSGESDGDDIALNGAGATFPYPLYSKWMSEYNKLHPTVKINYQSIGSGGGIRQISAGTVDFGASDVPMKESEAAKASGKLQHIPTTIGAVAVAYNVPGVSTPVKLTPAVLADVFLGKIDKWNDERLTAINPNAALPDKQIAVVFRSDGSGTTGVFTDYLAKVSPSWKSEVGVGKSVKWPAGLGAKGNEGVTGQIKMTPGSIGYVELAYAMQSKLPTAALQNKAGEFVEPSLEAVTRAAAGVNLNEHLYASITNSGGKGAYPIAAYTYILVYQDMKDPRKAAALAKFLWWAVTDGQAFTKPLHYAPLPAHSADKVKIEIRSLKAEGKLLISGA